MKTKILTALVLSTAFLTVAFAETPAAPASSSTATPVSTPVVVQDPVVHVGLLFKYGQALDAQDRLAGQKSSALSAGSLLFHRDEPRIAYFVPPSRTFSSDRSFPASWGPSVCIRF